MIPTSWHRLDPETAAGSLDLMDSDQLGRPVPAATRAEILAAVRDRVRRGEVVAIIRLHDGDEEVFLGLPAEVAAWIRRGLH